MIVLWWALIVICLPLVDCGAPTATESLSLSVSITLTPSVSDSISKTLTNSMSLSESVSQTDSISLSKTISSSLTDTVSKTLTVSLTDTDTLSSTLTDTLSKTLTFSLTDTISSSLTDTLSKTLTYSLTDTLSSSLTDSLSNTLTFSLTKTISTSLTDTFSLTETYSLSETISRSLTFTESLTQTISPSLTDSLTNTKSESLTDTISPSLTISPSPTLTQSLTATISLTKTQTVSPTDTFSLTKTISETLSVTDTPSKTFSLTISVTSTPSLTFSLTNTVSLSKSITVTPTDSVTPTETRSLTNTISVTPTDTPSPTNTVTPSATFTDSLTKTTTLSKTFTESLTPTDSLTPTFSLSNTITDSLTETFSLTKTVSPTNTITASLTKTFSLTETFTPSLTFTVTPSLTDSLTGTISESLTISVTPTDTISPTPTFSFSLTLTESLTKTFSLTNTITVSPTISVTPTKTFTVTPTDSPSVTLTISKTQTISVTPTFTITPTDTFSLTNTISVTPTDTMSPTLTFSLTNTISVTPTDTFSKTITESVTPTDTLTKTVTVTPTDTMTKTNTISVTPTDTFTPSITSSLSETFTPSITDSLSNTISMSLSITDTLTLRTPTVTFSLTLSETMSLSSSITLSITQTISNTVSKTFTLRTPTVTSTETFSNSISLTESLTYSSTLTLPTPTVSPTFSTSVTVSVTVTPTFSVTPTLPTPTETFTPSLTMATLTNTVSYSITQSKSLTLSLPTVTKTLGTPTQTFTDTDTLPTDSVTLSDSKSLSLSTSASLSESVIGHFSVRLRVIRTSDTIGTIVSVGKISFFAPESSAPNSRMELDTRDARASCSPTISSQGTCAGWPTDSPQEAIDPTPNTQWTDANMGILVVDFGRQQEICEYSWTTGSGPTARDPVTWVLEGTSDNGVTWQQLHRRTDFTPPSARGVSTQRFNICRPEGECVFNANFCTSVGQRCVDPNPNPNNSGDWYCECIAPAAGRQAVGALADCKLDECKLAANRAICTSAGQECLDADQSRINNWQCRCPSPATGFDVMRAATCVYLGECATITTCRNSGFGCIDQTTGNTGDTMCTCLAPSVKTSGTPSNPVCEVDECIENSFTCSAVGQTCRDRDKGSTSLGNWFCHCANGIGEHRMGPVPGCIRTDACARTGDALCAAQGQTCVVPSGQTTDWQCECVYPSIGVPTSLAPTTCSYDECLVKGVLCQEAGQSCFDRNKTLASTDDWVCQCGPGQSGETRAAVTQTCTETNDCVNFAGRCQAGGQSCFDVDQSNDSNYVCQCVTPYVTSPNTGANQLATCTLDECILFGSVCTAKGQQCIDRNQAAPDNWECACILPSIGANAIAAAATCTYATGECQEASIISICRAKGQHCIDPNPSATSVGDWMCGCTPPYVGDSVLGGVANCRLDECIVNGQTCLSEGQICFDPSDNVLNNWMCRCTQSPSNTSAVGQPATCVIDSTSACFANSRRCEVVSQRCVETNSTWGCACISPYSGDVASQGVTQCTLDECNLYRGVCNSLGQTCVDTDLNTNNNWECRCAGNSTGTRSMAPADCVHTGECATFASTCTRAGQTCFDPSTAAGDWTCLCPDPQTGRGQPQMIAVCALDECKGTNSEYCAATGEECVDEDTGRTSSGNWRCRSAALLQQCAAAPAKICSDAAQDCVPNPQVASQFNCTCRSPSTGTPGINVIATCKTNDDDGFTCTWWCILLLIGAILLCLVCCFILIAALRKKNKQEKKYVNDATDTIGVPPGGPIEDVESPFEMDHKYTPPSLSNQMFEAPRSISSPVMPPLPIRDAAIGLRGGPATPPINPLFGKDLMSVPEIDLGATPKMGGVLLDEFNAGGFGRGRLGDPPPLTGPMGPITSPRRLLRPSMSPPERSISPGFRHLAI